MADTPGHTRAAFERVRTIRSRMHEFADPSILHGGVFRWPLMRRPDVESMLDGVQRDPVEPRHWRWLYSELHRGAIAGAPVPSPAEIEARRAPPRVRSHAGGDSKYSLRNAVPSFRRRTVALCACRRLVADTCTGIARGQGGILRRTAVQAGIPHPSTAPRTPRRTTDALRSAKRSRD